MTERFAYTPGHWTTVVRWPVCVAVDLPITDGRVAQLFATLEDKGTVESILDVLAQGSVSQMPAFGLLEVGTEQIRIVLRGQVVAHPAGRPPLTGQGLLSDSALPPATPVELIVGGPVEPSAVVGLPVVVGIVQARTVRWGDPAEERAPTEVAAASVISTAVTPAGVPTAAPLTCVSAPPSDLATPSAAVLAAASAPPSGPAAPPPPAVDEAAGDGFDHLFGRTRATSPAPATPPALQPPVWALPDPHATREALPTTDLSSLTVLDAVGQPLPALEPPPPPPPPPAPVDGLAPAAPPPAKPGFISSFDWRSFGAAPPAQSPPPVTAPPAVEPVAAPPLAIASVAPSPPLAPASPPLNTPAPAGPAIPMDDRTIKRPRPVTEADGPIVAASRCPNGHLNPPYTDLCRVCRQVVPPQTPFEAPRPPLGSLRLSTGEVIRLADRGVILGRNPQVIPGAPGPQPHLVRIADPGKDVSSQHLEVRLDEWFVIVRDLGSTNGTEVILPDRPAVTLRANEPMTIEPGTRVVLAQVFDFVLQVTP